MKIFKKNDVDVLAIEFCCPPMAEDVLLGVVKTTHWTDHPLFFNVKDYRLAHCGHCGARIDGDAPIDDYKKENRYPKRSAGR